METFVSASSAFTILQSLQTEIVDLVWASLIYALDTESLIVKMLVQKFVMTVCCQSKVT